MSNCYNHLDSDGLEILSAYTAARAAGKSMWEACSAAYWHGRTLKCFRHLRAHVWAEKLCANSGGKGPRSYSCPLGEMVDACLPRGNRLPFGVSNYGSHSAAYPRTKKSYMAAAAVEADVSQAMEDMHLAFLVDRFGGMGIAA